MNGLNGIRPRTIAAILLVLWLSAPGAYAAPVALTNGVPVTGLSGAGGSQTFYVINVPAGQDLLEISISGGTGDCDMYVRRGAEPTLTSYDYRPYEVGNEETVLVESPEGGSWYIMLRGYTAYTGLTLVATYSASNNVVTLTNGVPVENLSAPQGTELYYEIDVPDGVSQLEISISGGTGDCDLHVKYGALPTTTDYDYRPFVNGNEETVIVEAPAEGTWYIMLRAYTAFSGLSLLASHDAGAGNVLDNGVPVPNLSAAQGEQVFYQIEVPEGQTDLEIAIFGGVGDCDLLVKYGAAPTLTDYDYRPYLSGNNETVSVASPAAGTWYIMLHAYNAYSGVTLVASYGGLTTLEKGVPVEDISGGDASEQYFQIDVPSGQIALEISISGGVGNCNLYVKRGALPTTSDWDYRPYESDNDETVTVDNPQSDTWYVMLRGEKAYEGVTLLADYWVGTTVTPLVNGVPVPNISGAEDSERFYVISVPADQDELEISITGGTGDADMYVKLGATPTITSYDFRPYLIGNDETVTIENPAAGDWYIMLRAYHEFSGVTLLAAYRSEGSGDEPTPLANGVPVTGIAGTPQSETFFMIEVPANQLELEIAMSGGTGDADIYIRRDALPTAGQWDYRPYLIGNNEAVTIDTPTAGTYYIMIRGYTAYAGVTLVATYTPIGNVIVELTNGTAVTGIADGAGGEKMYSIEVPAGQDYLEITIAGGTGNCDLYVKQGAQPTPSSWDYRPYLSGNEETVYVEAPDAATWYIMLRARQDYAGVTLRAKHGIFGVGNNFVDDPNCVALWTFEQETFRLDMKGTNDLENEGASVQLTEFKEGAGAADFKSQQRDWMIIDDADLSDDFPTKSTTAAGYKMSICFWMRLKSYSYAGTILSKYLITTDDRSWRIWLDTGRNELSLSLGIWGGDDYDSYVADAPETRLQLNNWYHVAFTYNDANRNYHMRIWDDAADALYYDVTSVAFDRIAITDAPLVFGNIPLQSTYFDGLLDEVVVFKDVLTELEIDQIRQGAYMNPVSTVDENPGQQK